MAGPAAAWLNEVMSILHDGVTAPSWLRVGRVAGAGLGGAVIGVLVTWIWEAGSGAANASDNACESAPGAHIVCIAILPGAEAIAGNIVVIIAGTLITMWTLQVRPEKLTVPVGCIVIAVAIACTGFGFSGGRGPAPWAAAIAAAAGLVAVALSVDRGRAQIAGLIGVGVVLLGSFIAPRTIARHEEADSQAAKLTRLGFPLELPSVPGYYPMNGYATPGGSLEVAMGRHGAAGYLALAFTVDITTASTSDGAIDLGMCKPGEDPQLTPQYSCQAEGAGRWLVTESGTPADEALADNLGTIAVAEPIGTHVSSEVLLRAVTSLRPASAAEIAALS
jgi:hypothetical protein